MVCCNICGKHKKIEDLIPRFFYVCVECWEKMEIFIDGEEIEKDLIY